MTEAKQEGGSAQVEATKDRTKQLGARVPYGLYQRMMQMKTDREIDLQEQVQQALDEYLTRHGF